MEPLQYPMGPQLRAYLGGEDRGVSATTPTTQQKDIFIQYLLDNKRRRIDNPNLLIEIVDELVAMDLGLPALILIDRYQHLWSRNDFRGVFAEGIAAMLAGEWQRSVECFSCAQQLVPEEPAPYVNLAQCYLSQGMVDLAVDWLKAGLNIEPNNQTLWQLLNQALHEQDEAACLGELQNVAHATQSWVGICLCLHLSGDADTEKKAESLLGLFHDGLRQKDFLIELSGVLGASAQYDKIPQILWDVEKNNPSSLSWQLRLHTVQALVAAAQRQAAEKQWLKLCQDSTFPKELQETMYSQLFQN